MDCPECGGSLDAYVLGGREAVTCVRCGWVGIEADHRGEQVVDESWGEALGRFYERRVETARRADLPPVASARGPTGEGTPDGEREGAASEEGTPEEETADDAGGTADGAESDAEADPDAEADGSGEGDENGALPDDDGAIRPE